MESGSRKRTRSALEEGSRKHTVSGQDRLTVGPSSTGQLEGRSHSFFAALMAASTSLSAAMDGALWLVAGARRVCKLDEHVLTDRLVLVIASRSLRRGPDVESGA